MTIASTLFTSNLSEPSEAKGPRAGLLTLPINSSKVSFTTYFWMLPPMPKLKGWLKGSQGGETFVTQPSTRLPDRRHLSWKHMPCPTAMSCGWASRHWGDLKAAQPGSLSMSLFVPQVRSKITTKDTQMDMFMISSQVHLGFALMSQWCPKNLQLLLVTSFLATYLSYQFQCCFRSHRVW